MRPRLGRALALPPLLALLAVATAACSGGDSPPAPRVGEVAPPYTATTLDGDTVTLASFRGQPVLLNLWATWCAPCRQETPFLESVYEKNRDRGFQIVGISMDTRDQKSAVADFVDEYDVSYTVLWDPGMAGMDRYQVLGLPATFLLDKDGIIRWMRYGPVGETDEKFLMAVEAVLE